MNLKLVIKELIEKALDTLNVSYDENTVSIEIPKIREQGDFSSNIAMKLSRELKDNPRNIAEKLVEILKNNQELAKVDIAGPGFINFYLDNEYIFSGINNVIEEDSKYGSSNIGNNKKVNIEFVSANPTGILHLGTARGASYGANLANIMSFAGFDVTKEYYINDAGNQINNLGLSLYARYKGVCGLDEDMPEDGYYGNEIIDIAKELFDKYGKEKLEEDLEFFKVYATNYLLEIIKSDLSGFGVDFDVWTSEKAIRAKGRIEESLKILDEKGLTFIEEDAKWLKTTVYGDDKDRVLVKSDGSYTYLVPDIAYHLDKLNRGFDKLIDILGADHHGYIARLKAAVTMLGGDSNKLEVPLVQMVRAMKDGKEYKLSKRTGKTITMADLATDVGVDALRYFFVSRSLDTQMDFDIDLATKQTNENPVYYIQYAHARICSILNNMNVENVEYNYKFETLNTEDAYNVLKKIYEFKDVVAKAALKKEKRIRIGSIGFGKDKKWFLYTVNEKE